MPRKRIHASQPQEEATIAATRLAFGLMREESPFNGRGLSTRTIRQLMDNGVDFPERLLFMSTSQLKKVAGLNKTSTVEIRKYRKRFIPNARKG
jgi:hypothetical protein